MSLLPVTDLDTDVRLVVVSALLLPRRGVTVRNLRAIKGVSFSPWSRFGRALDAAVERGLLVYLAGRYRATARGRALVG